MSAVRWRERSLAVRWWRLWRSRRPVTFTEKVRYKMLRDHRPLLMTFADKDAVRDYVACAIGGEYLPEVHALADEPHDLLELQLPDRYVVKPTHGSGAVIVVSPDAPADARLPRAEWSWIYCHVRPEHANRDHVVAIAEHWTSSLYGQGPNKEWAYGGVPRRVIVEEHLTGPDGAIPDDYKLFVFHQQVQYIQVDSGRFGERTQDFYLPDWTHLEMSGGLPWATIPRARPDRLDETITVAEILAADTDFVRVDLYHLADRVVFGELTSYPAGGHSPFIPERWNTVFGGHWTVPGRYR